MDLNDLISQKLTLQMNKRTQITKTLNF